MSSSDGDAAGAVESGDAWAWWAWAGFALVAAALILYLNRGTIFRNDELIWFSELGGDVGVGHFLEPRTGHLQATVPALFLGVVELFGPNYLVLRLLSVAAVLLASALLFAFAKPRIGAPLALVPAVLLLFYGSAWHHVVSPIGLTVIFAVACGLAAFVALDRDTHLGDVVACAALCLGLLTFSSALGFVVGALAWVLLRDGHRRIWIALIPTMLYAIWWIWGRSLDQRPTELGNLLDVPTASLESLAIDLGGATGVNAFLQGSDGNIGALPANPLSWVLAGGMLLALALRIRRGAVPPSLWAVLMVPLTYWAAISIRADPFSAAFTPIDAVRYVYPGTVGVVLVGVELLRGVRVPRRAWVAIAAIAAFSLAVNVDRLFDGGSVIRAEADRLSAGLAAYEIAAGVEPGGGPSQPVNTDIGAMGPELARLSTPKTADYLRTVGKYGSPAMTLEELRGASPELRLEADLNSIRALEIAATPAEPPIGKERCRTIEAEAGTNVVFTVPPGGALIRNLGPRPSEVGLRRLGDTVGPSVGTAEAGAWTKITIPGDAVDDPWHAELPAAPRVVVCPGA